MRVGTVGLGLLGRAIAGRLIGAGHDVVGYDIAPMACDRAKEAGVVVLADAREVAARTNVIFLSLMTSDDRRALMWGKQSMASALAPGTIVLDTSTARPDDLIEDAERLARQRVRLIDVCVSGSSEMVARGDAIALVGGKEEGAEYADLIKTFCKRAFFLGGPGQGNRMKLIVNLVMGLNRLVLAEALGLAHKSKFDLNLVLEILKSGGTYSAVMDTKGPRMVNRSYKPPAARLAQHAKDVKLILEYAWRAEATVPLSGQHSVLLEDLIRQGFGDMDNAAVFELFRNF